MNSPYDIEFLDSVSEKLKAIGHPIRFLMVDMLAAQKEMTVSEIHEQLDIEQAVASHHLRILKNQNIVKLNKDGKNARYSLAKIQYHDIVKSLIS